MWCTEVHSNLTCCLVSNVNGLMILADPWMNFLKYPTSPRKAQTCLGVVGGCMCCMARVLDGKGLIPVALRMCPRYWISLKEKLHLLFFMERLADLSFSKTILMCQRCS